MPSGEFELIAALSRKAGFAGERVVRGIGDDAAVLDAGSRWLVLTVDALAEGIHFRRDWMTLSAVGRRAAAVNLSDLAAMGARPLWALVSLLVPEGFTEADGTLLYDGLCGELARFGAAVVGGNVSRSPGGLVVDVTLVGECEPGQALWRTGARPGDLLMVTGSLGRAAAGRWLLEHGRPGAGDARVQAYLAPEPRLAEGRAAARSGACTAGLDISDGLAGDLRRLAEASRVGLVVELAALPVDESTRSAAAEAGLDPAGWALFGGDDYELLLAADPGQAAALRRAVEEARGTPVTVIGAVTRAEDGLKLRLPGGRLAPLPEGGWDHLRPPPPTPPAPGRPSVRPPT